ncbi:hypothetical protein Clacol_003311 [Clathrus columnatus]|uniref:AMP-dependent synthetase/ligase domain-containing protein n=1 Tax=Clathrus columnatus TaxID=1419009 RepID=A0AAV5A352_9AGAM|nr:hypothetical protein Clacol_003311 [Clathrus columnatus]
MSSTALPQPPSQSQPQLSRKYPEYISWVMLFPSPLLYTRQTVEVEPSKKDNETAQSGFYDLHSPLARRNVSQLFQSGYQLPKSIVHPQFKSGFKRSNYAYINSDPHFALHPADEDSGSKPCLGHRPLLSLNPLKYASEYVWMTYEDVDRRRRELGSAFKWFFRKLESDGLTKKGRNAVVVGPGEVKDEMGLEMETICVWAVNSVEWKLVDLACQAYGKVITALYDSSSNDTVGVVLLHSDTELGLYEAQSRTIEIAKSWAKSLGVDIWGIEEFMRIGRQHLSEPIDVAPEAIYSLCYTSGTTGHPKAAILTHGQVALTVSSGSWGIQDHHAGITMSALPLPHVYQRLINNSALNRGGAIGFPIPNPLLFLEDMQLLKPTAIPTVPRVLNRIYQAIMSRFADGSVKASLFHYAVKRKIEILRSTGRNDHPVWDKVIFNKIKPLLGGNLTTMACGSAATSPDILDFVRIAFGCQVYNETFALSFRVLPQDPTGSFTVGTLGPSTEAKLVDVAELGYFVRPQRTDSSDESKRERPRGELCLRNPNITKLSNGEFVALERVESLYSASPVVAQLFVYGDMTRDYLVAIVVPFATSSDTADASSKSADNLKTSILLALDEQAKIVGLKRYERIRNIHVTNEMFSVEDDTLTPTLKIRRRESYMKYKDVIEELYKMPLPSSSSSGMGLEVGNLVQGKL